MLTTALLKSVGTVVKTHIVFFSVASKLDNFRIINESNKIHSGDGNIKTDKVGKEDKSCRLYYFFLYLS